MECIQAALHTQVEAVEQKEGPMRIRAEALRRSAKRQPEPVELAAGVDATPPSELDSVEINRPPTSVIPEADGALRSSVADIDYQDGLIPVESEGTRALDQFSEEEKIAVGHIVNAASSWLFQHGIQPSNKVVRSGSHYRRHVLGSSHDAELPLLTEIITLSP
jgi:hypothetical protein